LERYSFRKGGPVPESRRKFKRYHLPQAVKFRPTYGATDYYEGAAVNLSCGGLGLDAHDFRFILYENLELVISAAGHADPPPLSGDIIWKKQAGKRCLAGIEFRMKNKSLQQDAIENIFYSSNIPAAEIYMKDPDYVIHGADGKSQAPDMKPPAPNKLGLVKEYYKNGARCKVTFRLLREMTRNAENVALVGEFNNWDVSGSAMTRLENGDFVITLDLDSNKNYRFRYLLDGRIWVNDWYADRFAPNEFGSKDSVVIL